VVSATRRSLLAGAALALAGCGARSEDEAGSLPGTSSTGRRADAEVLAAALEVKLAALAVHRGELRVTEQEQVERLRAALHRAGVGDPEPAGAFVDGLAAETASVASLQDLVPKVSDRDLRSMLARLMVQDAEQLATLRERAGVEPAPDAFLRP
jgi:hypothetical protein